MTTYRKFHQLETSVPRLIGLFYLGLIACGLMETIRVAMDYPTLLFCMVLVYSFAFFFLGRCSKHRTCRPEWEK